MPSHRQCVNVVCNPKKNQHSKRISLAYLPFDNFSENDTSYLATMENLINYLLQFGQLNQQQIDLIKSKATVFKLKKEEYFSEAGKIARQVAFLDKGILRVCYYNKKGEEITRYFNQ